MNRNTILKILNPIMGILIINQVIVGLLSDSLEYGAFEILHKGGGILLALLIGLHLILNWGWVKTTYFKPPIKKQSKPLVK